MIFPIKIVWPNASFLPLSLSSSPSPHFARNDTSDEHLRSEKNRGERMEYSERHDAIDFFSLARRSCLCLHVANSHYTHIVIRLVNFNLFYKIINKSFSFYFFVLRFVCIIRILLPFCCQVYVRMKKETKEGKKISVVLVDVGRYIVWREMGEKLCLLSLPLGKCVYLSPCITSGDEAFNAQKYHIYPRIIRADSSYECSL